MYNLYLAKWHKLPNKKGFFNKINELLGNDWICKNCNAENNFKKYCRSCLRDKKMNLMPLNK